MRVKYLIPIIVVLTCSLISCKKDNNEEQQSFSAVVVDYNTLQPMPNIKVRYTRQGFYKIYSIQDPWYIGFADTATGYNHFPPSNFYLSIDSTYTDASGRFSFTYTPIIKDGLEMPFSFSILSNSVMIAETNFSRPSFYTHGNDSIFADKKAYMVINMQKTTPALNNDTVFQYRQFFKPSVSYGRFDLLLLRGQVGLTSRTIIDSFPVSKYTKAAIEWRYYRNGLQSSAKDTVNLNTTAGSFTQVNISY